MMCPVYLDRSDTGISLDLKTSGCKIFLQLSGAVLLIPTGTEELMSQGFPFWLFSDAIIVRTDCDLLS